MTNAYNIFDVMLFSEMPLPELNEYAHGETAGALSFELGNDEQASADVDWFHDWPAPDGTVSIRAGRDSRRYWLRFPAIADFSIDLNLERIVAYVPPAVPDVSVRHLLLDQVIPRVLGQRGRLVLHAAAVVLSNGKTIALVGESGHGKSTLVSSFQRHGAVLISDDCVLVAFADDKVSVVANYPGVRLYPDSSKAVYGAKQSHAEMAHYSGKQRVVLTGDSAPGPGQAAALDALFCLNDPATVPSPRGVTIELAAGMSALMRLVAQTFVLDVADKQLMATQFDLCGRLMNSDVRFYNLAYPRVHDKLEMVRHRIESALDHSSIGHD